MTAMTLATQALEDARRRHTAMLIQDASPTTPGTAKKCILPKPSKNASAQIYRQLHKNRDGILFYKTQHRPFNPVDPADPRIHTTASVRERGLLVYDGAEAKVHHRDV